MLVLLLMIVGAAMIVGAKGFAGKAAKAAALVVLLVLGILPCLVKEFCCSLAESERQPSPWDPGAIGIALLLFALTLTGFLAWRRRSDSARARELMARRHGSPRQRALPQPGQTQD